MSKNSILALIFGFMAFICLSLSALLFRSTLASVSGMSRARATVISIIKRGEKDYPVLSFVDELGSGQQISSIPNTTLSSFSVGQSVDIFYDNDDLNRAHVNSFLTLWLVPTSLLVVGLLATVAGILYWVRAGLGANKAKFRNLSKGAGSSRGAQQKTRLDTQRIAPNELPTAPSKSSNEPSRDEVLRLATARKLFAELQVYVDDPEVSDIIARDYQNIEVRRAGKSFTVDTKFVNQEAYEGLVDRLLLAAGVSYSISKPIVDGMIGSHVRVHAVNKVLCETGPYLTVRISRFPTVTLEHLRQKGLAPGGVLTYLQRMVTIGGTLLAAGEVATGKTTLVRALAAGIDDEESVLVIEDTPEVKIDHKHARYIRTREANVAGFGEISHSECIRAGMRMGMTRIIFGEIRDAQAAEAFLDVTASGHPGISTIHSRNCTDAFNRLELFLSREQPGVARNSLLAQVANAVQCVAHLRFCPQTEQRRISEVVEYLVTGEGEVVKRRIFEYGVFDGHPGWTRQAEQSLFETRFKERFSGSGLADLPPAFGL